MNALQCNSCGATLLPDTSFCRQCGAPISGDVRAPQLEYPTAPFSRPADNVTTQRLDPRPTSDRSGRQFQPPYAPSPIVLANPPRAKAHSLVVGGIALIVLLLAIIAVVAVVKMRAPTRIVKVVGQGATVQGDLVYPGAETLVDMTGPDGGRVLQLRASDPLQLVQHWYETTLQPTKMVKLGSASVVLKNDKVTATFDHRRCQDQYPYQATSLIIPYL